MARLTASLFLVWALLLAPALCAGGFLEHACDCGNDVDYQCQHEDCTEDPCVTVVRVEDQDAAATLELELPWVPVAIPLWDAEPVRVREPWSSGPPPPPDRSSLPYAQSDRPLLI